jgi:hypothetical protein
MSGNRAYEQQLRTLEEGLRPRPRGLLRYLLTTTTRALAHAAQAADDHAEALERLEPPSEAAAAHYEYVAALRAVARDSRQLAEQKRRTRRGLLKELRALPSYQRMVETREVLLAGRTPED